MKLKLVVAVVTLGLLLSGCSSVDISKVEAAELDEKTTEDVSVLLDNYTLQSKIQETIKTVKLSEVLTDEQLADIVERISIQAQNTIDENGLVTADDIATLKQSIESEILASIEEKSTQAEVQKIADAVVAQASAEVGQQNAVLLDELDAKLCEAINSIGTVSPISTGGQDTLISEIKNSVITQINNEGITAATSPVKGKDYFTQAEVNSMVANISNQLISDGTLKVTVTNEITDSEVKDITDAVMVVVLDNMNSVYATKETETALKNSLDTMISKADSMQTEIEALQVKLNNYDSTQKENLTDLKDEITRLSENYYTLKNNSLTMSRLVNSTAVSVNAIAEAIGDSSKIGSTTTLISKIVETGNLIGSVGDIINVKNLDDIPSDITYSDGNTLVDSINNLYLMIADAKASMNGNTITYEEGKFYIENESGTKVQLDNMQEELDALQLAVDIGKKSIVDHFADVDVTVEDINADGEISFEEIATTIDGLNFAEMMGIFQFDYKDHNAQTFTVPINGTYIIEAYGAGSVYGQGQKVITEMYLEKDTVLYIYPGKSQDNTGWQGTNRGSSVGGTGTEGYISVDSSGYYSSGATDVRLVKATDGSWYDTSHTSWNTDQSLLSRIVTAGGGAGAGGACNSSASAAGTGEWQKNRSSSITAGSNAPNSNGTMSMGSPGYGSGYRYSSNCTSDCYQGYVYGGGGGGYYGGTASYAGTSYVVTSYDYNGYTIAGQNTVVTNGKNYSDGFVKISMKE